MGNSSFLPVSFAFSEWSFWMAPRFPRIGVYLTDLWVGLLIYMIAPTLLVLYGKE